MREIKKHIWRKVAACCLAIALLTTILPASVMAEGKPAVSLEQAIRIIKENFNIPAGYTKFTSGYNNDNKRQTWTLNWNAPAGPGSPGGSFNAQVDAATGEVVSMDCWRPVKPSEQGVQIPAVSQTKARQIANDLIKRLAAKHLTELQPVLDNSQPVPLNYGPVTYNFRWQRLINGVPFPTDGVSIGINGNDGQAVNYNFNWKKAAFPTAAGAITPEKAQQVFSDAGMLELQYFRPSSIMRPLNAGVKEPVKLVYQLHHPSNGVIDAKTGKPLVPEQGKWLQSYGLTDGKGMENGAMPAGKPVPLSPAEQKEIEKTAKVISQSQAVAAVKKWLSIPAGMTLQGANLAVDGQSPDMRIWYLNWRASDKAGDGEPQFINARVNALNGELNGFDMSYPSDGKVNSGSIDRQTAQKIAEKFLQQVQPQRFREVKLDNQAPASPPVPLLKGQNPLVQSFRYQRLVKGIPFPANGMTVTVDTVNKKVVNYNLNWSTEDFPSPKGILNVKQANDAFLKYRPLTLSYIQLFGPEGPDKLQLVYQPLAVSGMPVTDMLDAKTGTPLDRQGKPLSQSGALHFNDIAGNFAEKEINLLGQAGIFGEYGNAFHPNEKITLTSLLRAMLMAKNGVEQNKDLTDQEIIKEAKEHGWLNESLPADSTVSRLTLAKLMIRMAGLDSVARIKGIYVVPYKDTRTLSPDSAGYVALAYGLGIIKGNGSTFNPEQAVTRAEAAVALVRTLGIKR